MQCSFCGKTEKADGIRLIAGGGSQPRAELPRVAICGECVALCTRILDAKPADRGAVQWVPLVHRSEAFEWTLAPQPDQGTVVVVRRVGSEVTVGGVYPAEDTVTEAVVQALIDRLYDRL